MEIRSKNFPKPVPKKPHVIDEVSFAKDFIVCICAWKGPIDDFKAHRKAAIKAEADAA